MGDLYKVVALCGDPSHQQTMQLDPLSVYTNVTHTAVHSANDRAFPVAGCRLWNSLPPDDTSAPTLTVFFRNRLKSYLFFSELFPS